MIEVAAPTGNSAPPPVPDGDSQDAAAKAASVELAAGIGRTLLQIHGVTTMIVRPTRKFSWQLVWILGAGLCVGWLAAGPAWAAENWPQWRGPKGNGSSNATGLPVEWSLEKNIVWKTELPWWSGGTPIIWQDRIFVTSPSPPAPQQEQAAEPSDSASQQQPPEGRGRRGGFGGQGRGRGFGGRGFGGRGFGRGGGAYGESREPGGSELYLLCLSKTDGSILWQHELDQGNRLWRKQNSSSPSPVTDGKRVWATTGTGAIVALDFEGNELWKRNLQEDYGEFGLNWGYASSPLLHDNKLYIQVLHGYTTDDPSYLLAVDGDTGETLWRVERPTDARNESPDAYTTPSLLEVNGELQIVVSGGDYVTGHDPSTGEELWRAAGLNPRRAPNYRIVASPVVADGMIYAPTRRRPLLALRAGGRGDISTSHLAWKWDDDAGPDVPTPVCDGTYFYMVDDQGIVTCLNAKTGEVIWGPQRVASGTVSASPLLADGKIYITNENAVTSVIAAGPEFKRLATNELDGTYTLSSIAVSGNQLFVRTSTHLYCIGEKD